jgi:antitoxin CptB
MSGTTRSSDGLDLRRRKLLFRAWHRGTREMELILGRFADQWMSRLTNSDLDEYERLMEVPDRELFLWITGEQQTPANCDTGLLRRLREFHLGSAAPE